MDTAKDSLGYSPEAIQAIIDSRRSITAQEQAQAAQPLKKKGRPAKGEERKGVVNTFTERGSTNAAYLTARIARDRPDILEDMKAGKYASTRNFVPARNRNMDRT